MGASLVKDGSSTARFPRNGSRAGVKTLSTGPGKPASSAHGQVSFFLCLPELRRHYAALAGQVRIVRRVEHDHRGSSRPRRRRRGRPKGRRRSAVSLEDLSGCVQDRAAARHRHRRTRSGRRRRIRAGFSDADRRRAGHRQVDPVDPGLRGRRAVGRPCRLRLGRGIDRPGAPARGPAWACRGARTARGANVRRGHRGDARLGRCAEIRGHRFHSDHVERCDRIGAWNGQPGARVGAGADSLRQGERRGFAAGWTRDQGRPDRRAARRRAYGRRGLLLRGRRRARLPAACGRPRTGSARPTRLACSR